MVKYLLMCLLLAASVSAQKVVVTASTDTTDYLLGDEITFSITVTAPREGQVLQPQVKDSIRQLELLGSSSSVDKQGAGAKYVFEYTLAGYDSLNIIVPPLPVFFQSAAGAVPDTFFTNAVSIKVHTVPVDTSAAIKDVKQPELIPFDWKGLLWVILIAVLVALAAFFIYRWYKKRPQQVQPPQIVLLSPAEKAVKALDELAGRHLWQDGKVKEYHSEITGIIRAYFEEAYSFPALETTTAEIISALSRGGRAPLAEITSGFLASADMVKFAKFIPMADINEKMLRQAYAIISYQDTLPERKGTA